MRELTQREELYVKTAREYCSKGLWATASDIGSLLAIIDRLTAEPATVGDEVRLRDALVEMLALFDDEGEFREEYEDQCSVAIEHAESALKDSARPVVTREKLVDVIAGSTKSSFTYLEAEKLADAILALFATEGEKS